MLFRSLRGRRGGPEEEGAGPQGGRRRGRPGLLVGPRPRGGGGALELTGVEVSQVFTVSPKRGAANATLEALAQAFTTPRKPRNVALMAWSSGEADPGTGAPPPRYLVGELASAEAGPSELRLRLRMSAAQARASAPENLPSPAPGFQAASCSLFLDPWSRQWGGTFIPIVQGGSDQYQKSRAGREEP